MEDKFNENIKMIDKTVDETNLDMKKRSMLYSNNESTIMIDATIRGSIEKADFLLKNVTESLKAQKENNIYNNNVQEYNRRMKLIQNSQNSISIIKKENDKILIKVFFYKFFFF